jgi:hypothetical protein
VTVPTVHLPRGNAAARNVVATVTVDREVQWSAIVWVYTYGGSDMVGHGFEFPVPSGQQMLEPGSNRVLLGTTATISKPGPQQVTVTTSDPSSGAEIGRATAVIKVVGQLPKPRISGVRVQGHRVILRGMAYSNVPDLRLAVIGRHRGAGAFKQLTKVKLRRDGHWTARLRIHRPTRLRVQATSAYGTAAASRTVTVRP